MQRNEMCYTYTTVLEHVRLKSLIDVLLCKLHYGWNRLPTRSKHVSFFGIYYRQIRCQQTFDTLFWICFVILSKETLASVRVMNHVHSVTFLHRYIVSVDNKFRKNLRALNAWAVDFNRNAVYICVMVGRLLVVSVWLNL
jgi:hypothetical protein